MIIFLAILFLPILILANLITPEITRERRPKNKGIRFTRKKYNFDLLAGRPTAHQPTRVLIKED